MGSQWALAVLVNSLLIATATGDGDTLVSISQGQLQGEVLNLVTGDGTYYSFKGIPYAAPPIGDLRFKAPMPPLPWEGIRNATAYGSVCHQYSDIFNAVVNGSEDCLFLNVYSPNLNPQTPFAVMVYIHGGNYQYGSGNNDFYGPDLLLRKNVVVVTINYRTEVFGFLSLQNEEVPGNAGMKDQAAALKWVNENINAFGGDPANITLFGQSSGASGVSLHLFSEQSIGLFHRAIMQSGTALVDWALTVEPKKRAFELGRQLGLNTTDETELLAFLKEAPKEKLINITADITTWDSIVFGKVVYFGPVVEPESDTAFLTKHPLEYLKTGQIVNDVDFITGVTSEEAILSATGVVRTYAIANEFPIHFATLPIAYSTDESKRTNLSQEIKEHYLGNELASNATLNSLVKYHSMSEFNYPAIKFTNLMSTAGEKSRYFYEFLARSERSYFSQRISQALGVQFDGVSHSDDISYIFDMPVFGLVVNKTAESFDMIEKMTTMWTNFAKYGDPTPDTSLGPIWPKYTAASPQYLRINYTSAVATGPFQQEFDFWKSIDEEFEC